MIINNYELLIQDLDNNDNIDDNHNDNKNELLEINFENRVKNEKIVKYYKNEFDIDINNIQNMDIIQKYIEEYLYLSSLHDKMTYELKKNFIDRKISITNKYNGQTYFITRDDRTKLRINKRKVYLQILNNISNSDTKKYVNLHYKNIIKI